MSIQHTLEARYLPLSFPVLTGIARAALALRHKLVARLQRRLTERLLAELDPSILEDIGVPHDQVSPSAGALERYPTVITPSRPRI
jgi:hypothetical protein